MLFDQPVKTKAVGILDHLQTQWFAITLPQSKALYHSASSTSGISNA
ncbi:hypothetical protein EDC91_104171 [Shewanella fodinae]|uniref:Uncharacterized protein n=1 Tax=Shewanella fodinae TaxID=552357 RepID=A0A4V2RSV8_9GAMM|nr:hypothetical protein EDC91_104171 [Shewanella fodinae]